MNTIQIRNQPDYYPNLIVGLDWHSVPLKEQRVYLRKMRATGYRTVVCASGKDSVNVGQIERVAIPRSGKSVSLAAWVANSFKQGTIVACEKVDAGEQTKEMFWLAVVNDGQVVAGTDIVTTWSGVTETVREIIDVLGASDAGYIGSHGAMLPSNFSAKDSLELKDALLKASIRRSLLAQDNGNAKAVPIIAAGVVAACVVLGLGGSWAYNAYEDSKAIERAEQARMQRVRRAEQAWLELASDIAQQPHAANAIKHLWSAALSDLPESVGGWRFLDSYCTPSECVASYRNNDFTPIRLFRSKMEPQCDTIEVESSNREAMCRISVSQSPKDVELTIPTANDVLRESTMDAEQLDAFVSDVMALFHLMGRDQLSVSDASAIKSRSQQLVVGVPELFQGGWAMEIPLEHVPLVTDMLARFPGLTLAEMTIQGSNKITNLSGQYFKKVVSQ